MPRRFAFVSGCAQAAAFGCARVARRIIFVERATKRLLFVDTRDAEAE
jgi:hypothetical protein